MLVDYISYQDFLSFFSKHPELVNEDYYSEFNNTPKGTVRYWKMKASRGANKTPTVVGPTKKKSIPPQDTTQEHQFIDDVDELLISAAIRQLNKPNPDPRWATILIACRKENIAIKSEVIDQLQKLPTKALTEMLRKQSGKSSLAE